MKLYLAPMEGITGHVFRTVYHRHYGGADRYFTPFISHRDFTARERADVLPENNRNLELVPQILTNHADEFLEIAHKLKEGYGYEEVDLNLGCPSPTVAPKNRGAGFLRVPDELRVFLDEVFSKSDVRISVKTRTGYEDHEGFERLVELYNDYPLTELIVHPRCREDYYARPVNKEAFSVAYEKSRHALCYNGDVYSAPEAKATLAQFPVEALMCGRGILRDPGLFDRIREGGGDNRKNSGELCCENAPENGKAVNREKQLKAFVRDLYAAYSGELSGEKDVLFKMKELYFYLSESYEKGDKLLKKIRKCQRGSDFLSVLNESGAYGYKY